MIRHPFSRPAVVALCTGALLVTAHTTGCGQVLGIGDLVFDLPNAGGAGGMTASGSGGSGGGGNGSVSTSTGMGGMGGGMTMLPDAPHLVLLGDSANTDRYGAEVEGLWRLEFFENTGWQLRGWFDLGHDPKLDLASFLPGMGSQQTDALFNGFIFQHSDTWFQVDNAVTEDITVIDQRPARIIFDTTMMIQPAIVGMQVDVRYTVYASGRVATRTVATNSSNQPQSLQDSEFNYTSVNHSLNWEAMMSPTGLAAAWKLQNTMPAPAMLIVSHGSETPQFQDTPTNFYWDSGALDLSPGETFTRDGEMQFNLSNDSRDFISERANDILNLATTSVTGAMDLGYDTAAGAYTLQAQDDTTPITVRLDGQRDRFEPVIVIEQFTATEWTLHLDDELLATSNDVSGPATHVYHDPNAQLLVIAYLNRIEYVQDQTPPTFTLQPL